MMKRMMVFAAAVGLALAVHGVVVTAADGDTVVIGTDVSNAANTELVVTTGVQGVTLVLPPADGQGIATIWARIYLKGTGTASFVAAEGQAPTAIVIASALAADDSATLPRNPLAGHGALRAVGEEDASH